MLIKDSPIKNKTAPKNHQRLEGGVLRVPQLVAVPVEVQGLDQPVSFGVPLPRGALLGTVAGWLENCDGCQVAVQADVLARWSDASVQWVLVHCAMPGLESRHREWTLVLTAEDAKTQEPSPKQRPERVLVETGSLSLEIGRHGLLSSVHCGAAQLLDRASLLWTDRHGRQREIGLDIVEAAAGPVRTVIRLAGTIQGKRGPCVDVRVHCYQGTGLVKLDVGLHNRQAARHRGGLWDLGDAGSVFFKEFGLELLFTEAGASQVMLRTERAVPVPAVGTDFELYQDSSGGDNWKSANHVNHQGRVPCRFRGYRARHVAEAFRSNVRLESLTYEGRRAEPVAAAVGASGGVCVAVPDFWQQFPKALACDGRTLRIGLFPREWDDLHELQGGERKTHTVWLYFGADAAAYCGKFDWVFEPLALRPTPAWIDETKVLPPLMTGTVANGERLDGVLAEALSSERGLLANRERVDEYGWRNYGELFADHEQTYYEGPQPLISHSNNQFEPLDGFLLHYLRTGDRRWFEMADALARHVADIDIYHTQDDRAAYNGGLFWFTDHYLHAGTSTHRTYTRANAAPGKDYGGGPSPAHSFTSGLLHHYYLTGNPLSAEAVLELASWVLAMDDGRQTILGLADDGPTGLASMTSAKNVPGRAAGNSVNALLDAWALTREGHYLDYAETLIRRMIHPADDISRFNLFDVEENWSYTVFLSSVAKYLDIKAEADELDDRYAYAQASLLHYAQWMLEFEQPYFDQMEKLEYPTEAWAAQEFRKANVLRKAARHADEPMRGRLLRRGAELAERGWSDLLGFDTRVYIRAVAIVMNEGLWDCAFRSGAFEPAPRPRVDLRDFGSPRLFESQRQRVKRRLRSPTGMLRIFGKLLSPWRWFRVRWRLK